MKRVIVLGSTGSIGRSTLEVVERLVDRYEIVGLAARQNIDLLERQIHRFRPQFVAIGDPTLGPELERRVGQGTAVMWGDRAVEELAGNPSGDIVVNGLVGSAGFRPTWEAVRTGKRVALANKETLVAYGGVVMEGVRKYHAELIPIDSEHSAVHQCLSGRSHSQAKRILLTASGGPFRSKDIPEHATRSEVLTHPTWNMGPKVTVDSATLMNKGLEVVEAHWLFSMDPDRISVVVHPESIVHSLVELVDGSMIAQLGVPDMRLPIQYALTYPERCPSPVRPLELTTIGSLTFEPPDLKRFRCLALAYEAVRQGGTAPAVLNAANEVAVEAFLDGRLPFGRIPLVVEETLQAHSPVFNPSAEGVSEADRWARQEARQILPRYA
jgi:1-deoxy-D-xylulose-5-phosphate reductoisomerase